MEKYYFRSDLELENPADKVYFDSAFSKKAVGKKTCQKCKGSGFLMHYGFSDQGRCWGCLSKGYNIFRLYTAKEMQAVIRANARKVAKQEVQRQERLRRAEEAKERANKREADFKKWKADKAAKSNFIGTVGDRQSFVFTVNHVHPMHGFYGMSYLNICRDVNDNVIIYKGAKDWGKGSVVNCIAGVKEHNVREGEKQTIIKIPKKVTINGETV